MESQVVLTRLAEGMYRIDHDGRQDVIYVATAGAVRWVCWNGRVFRHRDDPTAERDAARPARTSTIEPLSAPMPARIIKVFVQPGAVVRKGDTVVLLEAMKMELPVRAPANGIVIAVHGHEGELVQADARLVDLG